MDFIKRLIGKPIKNPDDFLDGMRDCDKGIPHKAGLSYEYNRGYGCQYEHEQNMAALGLRGNS